MILDSLENSKRIEGIIRCLSRLLTMLSLLIFQKWKMVNTI